MSTATETPTYQAIYEAKERQWVIYRYGMRLWYRAYTSERAANIAIGRMKRRDLEGTADQAKRLEGVTRKLGNELGLISTMLNQASTPIILPASAMQELEGLKSGYQLVKDHPGMLFNCGYLPLGGLSYDQTRLVFVPRSIYTPYRDQCLQEVGWSEEQEAQFYESISYEVEEETDEGDEYTTLATPDIPNPLEREAEWKARQVAHWLGEEDMTPYLNYTVWPNGTWG